MGLRKFKIRNGGLKHIYIHNDGNMRMTLCVIFFRNWDKFMRKILFEHISGNTFRLNENLIEEGLMQKLSKLPMMVLAGILMMSSPAKAADQQRGITDIGKEVQRLEKAGETFDYRAKSQQIIQKYGLQDDDVKVILQKVTKIYEQSKSENPDDMVKKFLGGLKELEGQFQTQSSTFKSKSLDVKIDSETRGKYEAASTKIEGKRQVVAMMIISISHAANSNDWANAIGNLQKTHGGIPGPTGHEIDTTK